MQKFIQRFFFGVAVTLVTIATCVANTSCSSTQEELDSCQGTNLPAKEIDPVDPTSQPQPQTQPDSVDSFLSKFEASAFKDGLLSRSSWIAYPEGKYVIITSDKHDIRYRLVVLGTEPGIISVGLLPTEEKQQGITTRVLISDASSTTFNIEPRLVLVFIGGQYLILPILEVQ